ncbi:MAG TPA: SdrD B-like domain-containing protein [Anaerolineae bacterium]|nr:SdrD B-like domain-containing protein [Anaerolineae bacterium]HQI83818.1 SdrD B-like domain-containing protein [Anaerolineae bacterium]
MKRLWNTNGRGFWIVLLNFSLALLITGWLLSNFGSPARPVWAAGSLRVYVTNAAGEPLNAYNLVVDSNINGMSTSSPSAATVIVRFCNESGGTLNNVMGYIGDYDPNNDSNPADSTVGVYPPRSNYVGGPGYDPTFNTVHLALASSNATYRFQHIGGALGTADGARYIGTLAAGECRVQYWHFTYPLCEANTAAPCRVNLVNGDATWGDSVKPNDDLWLTFDAWVTADGVAPDNDDNVSWKMTMRNEISAMANKIEPNPDGVWFNTDPNTIRPGGVITTNGVLYEFGNINQGFDNDGDFVPDYNAWAQPVGNADYDPSCFRLIRTSGYLDISRSGGNPNMILPFTNKLYFTNLPSDNTGVRGYVYYTFLALGGPCNTGLSPYQEVASGRDNEKFNADYGAGPAPLPSPKSDLTISKNGPTSVALNTTYTYNIPFANPGDADIGITLSSGYGVNLPLGIVDMVPYGLEYVCGTASATFSNYTGGYRLLFSRDGITWKESVVGSNNSDVFSSCPGTNPQSTTASPVYIRWELKAPLPKKNGATVSGGTATFQAKAPTTYLTSGYSPVVVNEACAKLATAGISLACGSTTTLIEGTNSIGNFVWADANKNGVQTDDGATPGIANVTVWLYWDKNGNGMLDVGDTKLFTTTTTAANTNYGTDGGLNGNYGFGCGADSNCTTTADNKLPSLKYLVVVDTADTDLPDGYAPTTAKIVPVDLSGLTNTFYRTADFGFGPVLTLNKSLASPSPAYVGENVVFSIKATNTAPGSFGGYCQYKIPAGHYHPAGGTDTPRPVKETWVNPGYAVGMPDSLLAALALGTNEDSTGLGQFNIGTNTGGTVTRVELWLYLTELVEFNTNDRFYVFPYYNNVTTGFTQQTLNQTYFTQAAPAEYLYKLDLTANRTWLLTDFASGSDLVELYLAGQKGTSPSGKIGVDAAVFVVTTDKTDCGGEDGVIATLPITDTFDSSKLQFVSADPAASVRVDTSKPQPNGLITWNEVGPLMPGETMGLAVTFKALATVAAPGTTNTAYANAAYFSNGRKLNQVNSSAQVPILASFQISGKTWIDTGGTIGWVAGSGYDPIPGTDRALPNVLMDLYVCANPATGLPIAQDTNENSTCTAMGYEWKLIASQYTDQNGDYTFTGLRPGYYQVRSNNQTLPAGMTSQTAEASGVANGTGVTCPNAACNGEWNDQGTAIKTLNYVNADKTQVNFGYRNATAGTITGFVWQDHDRDNVWDKPEEPPIPGTTVTLYLCNPDPTCNAVSSTTTDANGYYQFSNVPATTGSQTYRVVVTPPPGMAQSGDPEGGACYGNPTNCDSRTNTFTLVNGGARSADLFGYTGGLTLGDTVYVDWNGDGWPGPDAGEEGIGGVTVRLYRDFDGNGAFDAAVDKLHATTTTMYNVYGGLLDINGDGQITAADNRLSFVGYRIIGGGVDWNNDGVVNTNDDSGASKLLGYTVIDGKLDLDGNGTADDTDGTLLGKYLFTQLAGNTKYIVAVDTSDVPSGYRQTADPDEQNVACTVCDSMDMVTLGSSNYTDADFGYKPYGTASIGDRVWRDNDADGIQDPYEVGIGGVAVYLYQDQDGDGVLDPEDAIIIDTSTTINYQVVDGCIDVDGDGVSCTDAGDDVVTTIGLVGVKVFDGRLDMDGDGIVAYRVIAGFVDVDGDGVTGEADDTGYFYGRRIIRGYVDMDNDGVTNGDTGDVGTYLGYTVINGLLNVDGVGGITSADNETYAIPDESDDGLYLTYTVIDGKLDMNRDGSVTTADDGSGLIGMYQFTKLPAGSYIVQVPPSNFDQNTDALYALQQTNIQTPPGTENQHKVTLTTGQAYTDADFGYTNGAIGDLIWQDNNGNGSWDTGEPGIPGVKVWLYIDQNNDGILNVGDTIYDYDGNGVAGNTGDSVTTDSGGIYRFIGLPASATNKPYLVVIDPTMFNSGQPLNSTKFTLTYDPDGPTWDKTITPRPTYPPCGTGVGYDKCNNVSQVPLRLGQMDYGQDFGYKPLGVIGDTLWINTNGNTTQDAGEPGIPYVTVWLCTTTPCNASTTGVITTTTDSDGKYTFGGLADGTYYVQVNASDPDYPVGVTPNYDLDGTSTPNLAQVTLSGGGSNFTADFGYAYSGSTVIAGTVFFDAGANGGLYTSGDLGLGNVPVYLWRLDCSYTNMNVCGDAGDSALPVASTITLRRIVDGYVDMNGDGTYGPLDDGVWQGITVIDGKLDLNGNGTADDNGVFYGYKVFNGRLDVNNDGSANDADDAHAGAYYFYGLAAGNYRTVVSPVGQMSGMTLYYEPDEQNDAAAQPNMTDVTNDDGDLNCTAGTYSNTSTPGCNTNAVVNSSDTDRLTQDYGFYANMDLGDLPLSYDFGAGEKATAYYTPFSFEGPIHIGPVGGGAPSIYLGATWDGEADGAPNPDAGIGGGANNGDDGTGSDDEDGIEFPTAWYAGKVATIQITVTDQSPTYTPFVAGWFDWNCNGQFEATELIQFGNLSAGTHTFNITTGATVGRIYIRFRIYATQSPPAVLSPVGAVTNGEVEDYWKYNENPTAVTLAAFEATPQENGILVTWETASELDNVGFNLYRSESAEGPYTQLNATLIPPQNPGSVMGGYYEWLDMAVLPDVTYFYKLEDLDVKGVSTFHGPISTAVITAPTAVGLRNVAARGATTPLALGLTTLLGLAAAYVSRRRR